MSEPTNLLLVPERQAAVISATRRPLTIIDGMILVAFSAFAMWVSTARFLPAIQTGFSLETKVFAANPVFLTYHWGAIILRESQPAVAFFTFAALFLRILEPRPRLRRLVRQPGFAACCVVAMAICIGGPLRCVTASSSLWRNSFEAQFQAYIVMALLPRSSEPGMAVAAGWLLLILGKQWRPERTWLDRLGRLLGAYWLAMIVIATAAPRPPSGRGRLLTRPAQGHLRLLREPRRPPNARRSYCRRANSVAPPGQLAGLRSL